VTCSSSEAAGGAGETGARPGLDPTGVLGPRHDTVDPGGDEPAADGRRARGQRTRRNVAEALMDLLRADDPDPTARAVAQRAGVSLRLVFHHFSDMDDLYHFVATLQLRRLWSELPERPPHLRTDPWIERFVTSRAALYEEISPVRRALVRRTATSPGVHDALAAADGLLLEHLKATFGPELDALAAPARHESVAALDTSRRGRPGSGCA